MDSTTIVIAVVAVVVLVAIVVLAMRRSAPEPPRGEARAPEGAKPRGEGAERAKPGAAPGKVATAAPATAAPATAAPATAGPATAGPTPTSPAATARTAEAKHEPSAHGGELEGRGPVPGAATATTAAGAPSPFAEPAFAEPEKKSDGRDQVAALKRGLASTRGGFIARLARIFGGKTEIDPALLDQVQEVLITADIGVRTSEKMLTALRERQGRHELDSEDAVWRAIREEARTILGPSAGGVRLDPTRRPTTIVVVGVNGVGKTTTIGKLASRFKEEGKKVVLAAGDTFRAAAVLQLEVWAKRVGCEIVKSKDRADPASVIFDAIKKAQADGADVVIADTAGRLHTKANLMEELKKVVRTAEKALERPVDEILLVLESTTGQNAIQQAQLFKDAISISGIVLSKLDGTAKGGVVLGILDEHRIPVRYVGIGERVEDLREFDSDAFVQALFEKPDEETAAA
jgi:fused signal recognition particle receptor